MILFVVIAMWSFMEDVMPITHVDCSTELFGSHHIVEMCSHAMLGSRRLWYCVLMVGFVLFSSVLAVLGQLPSFSVLDSLTSCFSDFKVHYNYPGILWSCRLWSSRTGVGRRVCISNKSPEKPVLLVYGPHSKNPGLSWAALSNRTFYNDGNILFLHCPIW